MLGQIFNFCFPSKPEGKLEKEDLDSIFHIKDKSVEIVNKPQECTIVKSTQPSTVEINQIPPHKHNTTNKYKSSSNITKDQIVTTNQVNRIKSEELINKPHEESKAQYIVNSRFSHKEVQQKSNSNVLLNQSIVSESQKITDIEVQENPKLELTELEGNLLNGNKIEINASGMTRNSLRNEKDGETRFGFKNQPQVAPKNDYLLNIVSNSSTTTLFRVYFNRNSKKYFLASEVGDLDSIVVFIKLDKKYKLLKKNIISLGEIHLAIDIDNLDQMRLEIVYPNEETKTKIFPKENGKVIKVGRSRDNDITLENSAFSRVHTMFEYSQADGCWYVQDGNGETNSTNGTWVYLKNFSWDIGSGVDFRIGSNLLSIKKL